MLSEIELNATTNHSIQWFPTAILGSGKIEYVNFEIAVGLAINIKSGRGRARCFFKY